METWAERIRVVEAAGWSLGKIATHVGLSISSVSDIKNGRTKEPGGMAAVLLHKLADELRQDGAAPPAPATNEPAAAGKKQPVRTAA